LGGPKGRFWLLGWGWGSEGFGLLNEAYSAVKDPVFTKRLFG
jgi:hypothetical protein